MYRYRPNLLLSQFHIETYIGRLIHHFHEKASYVMISDGFGGLG